MMTKIALGDKVAIPCSIGPGAFLDEYLITINTTDGSISGFVATGEVTKSEDGCTLVYGIVRNLGNDSVELFLPGSFFTTTGIAHFPREMLENQS